VLVGLKVFIQPGQTVDMVFESALASGRYALVCAFPDVTGPRTAPHFSKGMLADFRRQMTSRHARPAMQGRRLWFMGVASSGISTPRGP